MPQRVDTTMHLDLPHNLPYRPDRDRLYDIDELLADDVDAAIWQHIRRTRLDPTLRSVAEELAQRLHDHAIDVALTELLRRHPRVVAIMGGHATRRDATTYRDVALLARTLVRRGYFVATGGGPGSMEAANLGAWLAMQPDGALEDALATLAHAPDQDHREHLTTALAIRDRYANGAASLSIPTWFYGHEPTNVFATHIAKYFSNSLREDGLLAIATHGVVYTPGRAGTVQEIFMDATQNHYGTFHYASPMVLMGAAYWTDELPVVNLLRTLARGRAYGDMIALLDDPEDVIAHLERHPPVAVSADGLPRPRQA